MEMLSSHTAASTEPAAARESMGFENRRQPGCRFMEQAQYKTNPPVVEPMVLGRHRAFPAMGLP